MRMHGLINRAIQGFAVHSYGEGLWQAVTDRAGLPTSGFEAMLSYDDALTERALAGLCAELGRPRDEVLEDIGTFLVSHPATGALRRLMRFGGEGFVDFLHSLDDLPDRVRMAVSDLTLPALELRDHEAGRYRLHIGPGLPGFGHVMIGLLRAMADDYGALVMLEHRGSNNGRDLVDITLVESAFAQGRVFDLGASAG